MKSFWRGNVFGRSKYLAGQPLWRRNVFGGQSLRRAKSSTGHCTGPAMHCQGLQMPSSGTAPHHISKNFGGTISLAPHRQNTASKWHACQHQTTLVISSKLHCTGTSLSGSMHSRGSAPHWQSIATAMVSHRTATAPTKHQQQQYTAPASIT